MTRFAFSLARDYFWYQELDAEDIWDWGHYTPDGAGEVPCPEVVQMLPAFVHLRSLDVDIEYALNENRHFIAHNLSTLISEATRLEVLSLTGTESEWEDGDEPFEDEDRHYLLPWFGRITWLGLRKLSLRTATTEDALVEFLERHKASSENYTSMTRPTISLWDGFDAPSPPD